MSASSNLSMYTSTFPGYDFSDILLNCYSDPSFISNPFPCDPSWDDTSLSSSSQSSFPTPSLSVNEDDFPTSPKANLGFEPHTLAESMNSGIFHPDSHPSSAVHLQIKEMAPDDTFYLYPQDVQPLTQGSVQQPSLDGFLCPPETNARQRRRSDGESSFQMSYHRQLAEMNTFIRPRSCSVPYNEFKMSPSPAPTNYPSPILPSRSINTTFPPSDGFSIFNQSPPTENVPFICPRKMESKSSGGIEPYLSVQYGVTPDLETRGLVKRDVTSPAVRSASDSRIRREPKFNCPYCGAFLTTKAGRKNHIHSHFGIKNHKCQTCKKAFVTKWDCKRHEKNIHQTN